MRRFTWCVSGRRSDCRRYCRVFEETCGRSSARARGFPVGTAAIGLLGVTRTLSAPVIRRGLAFSHRPGAARRQMPPPGSHPIRMTASGGFRCCFRHLAACRHFGPDSTDRRIFAMQPVAAIHATPWQYAAALATTAFRLLRYDDGMRHRCGGILFEPAAILLPNFRRRRSSTVTPRQIIVFARRYELSRQRHITDRRTEDRLPSTSRLNRGRHGVASFPPAAVHCASGFNRQPSILMTTG